VSAGLASPDQFPALQAYPHHSRLGIGENMAEQQRLKSIGAIAQQFLLSGEGQTGRF
jgi:hypothetical protein